MSVQIVHAGLLTTIQDEGRSSYAAYGVPRSGAFDPFLAAVANQLVGNARSAALLEFAVVGPQLKFQQSCRIAISAFGCSFTLNNKAVPCFSTLEAPEGSVLCFESMTAWFGYIAISGGLESEMVLQSRSTYLPGRIGKRLKAGDMIKIATQQRKPFMQLDARLISPPAKVPLLPALHTSLFTKAESESIFQGAYHMTAQSNRMGMRLQGKTIEPPAIRRSCPVVNGTLQIPPAGQPIILGPDGPTTGGYAQLGVIARIAWTVLAATPPGKAIEFEPITRETAVNSWNKRQQILESEQEWQRID